MHLCISHHHRVNLHGNPFCNRIGFIFNSFLSAVVVWSTSLTVTATDDDAKKDEGDPLLGMIYCDFVSTGFPLRLSHSALFSVNFSLHCLYCPPSHSSVSCRPRLSSISNDATRHLQPPGPEGPEDKMRMHFLCVGNSTHHDGWMERRLLWRIHYCRMEDERVGIRGRTRAGRRGMSERVSAVHIVTQRDFAMYRRSTTSDNNLM